jgi:hypothetical protein
VAFANLVYTLLRQCRAGEWDTYNTLYVYIYTQLLEQFLQFSLRLLGGVGTKTGIDVSRLGPWGNRLHDALQDSTAWH